MPGPFQPKAILINETLGNLGALGLGQAPDVEDFAYVDSQVDNVIRMLAALEICYIADPENIPSALINPLADIMHLVRPQHRVATLRHGHLAGLQTTER